MSTVQLTDVLADEAAAKALDTLLAKHDDRARKLAMDLIKHGGKSIDGARLYLGWDAVE